MLLKRLPCKKVSRLLWDYAAYRLLEADWESVERHLQDCARCRREMEQYRRAVRLVEAARSRPAPASETTWYALRAQLMAEKTSTAGHVERRSRAPRNIGVGLMGGLVTAMLVAAIVIPTHKLTTATTKGDASPSQPLDVADNALSGFSSLISQPTQVEEVSVSNNTANTAARPGSIVRSDNQTSRVSDAIYESGMNSASHFKPGWTGSGRHSLNNHITNHHRQEPQQNTPNLQYASVDGERPSDSPAQRNYVIDPLPAPSDQPRHFVMDMVNLSTPAPTLASNTGGDKDSDIW